jgi:hypothetical protein|tara:strand:+ start:223 stop:432 length:210 start_codon:yes stop_codon:yes gene_type:complete
MAKKSKVDLGKGFKRIYFALAGLWLFGWIVWAFEGSIKDGSDLFDFLSFMMMPFILYFILLFFIKGFKK